MRKILQLTFNPLLFPLGLFVDLGVFDLVLLLVRHGGLQQVEDVFPRLPDLVFEHVGGARGVPTSPAGHRLRSLQ